MTRRPALALAAVLLPALSPLASASGPSERVARGVERAALWVRVAASDRLWRQACALYDSGEFERASDLFDRLRRRDAQWAAEGLLADPTRVAARLTARAQVADYCGARLQAALLCHRALRHHPGRADARALQRKLTRRAVLAFQIARQRWRAQQLSDTQFVGAAIPYVRQVRAADPIHRQLPPMIAAIREAGGTIPPPDRLPERD